MTTDDGKNTEQAISEDTAQSACNGGLDDDVDICGLCGLPGADKYAHPIHWPGEQTPDGNLVHAECEAEECKRAHSLLSDKQRREFLSSI
jgi:hypothetical protein